MLLYSLHPLPTAGFSPPVSPQQAGRRAVLSQVVMTLEECGTTPGYHDFLGNVYIALIHAIMTLWVMYTFSLPRNLSPSFFMRTGMRLMTEPQKKRSTTPL